jgi:ankyrin repeat protein
MVDCLQRLIAARADVNLCTEDGRSPIYVAATFDFPKCIELLAAANGDVNKCQDDTRSPIFAAASYGKTSSVAQLLSARADPRSSFGGVSAVDEARARGHSECVRLLEDALQ